MPYVETAWNHANIPADLASVRPLGDFVLVRMLPEEEMHRNLIWLPQFSGAHADRQLRPVLPSIGEVVSVGPGDKLPPWHYECYGCHWDFWEWSPKGNFNCPKCRRLSAVLVKAADENPASGRRAPMHVSPGDCIMYWRVPANEVILNDETFQFLHEEQHVLGVIEDG